MGSLVEDSPAIAALPPAQIERLPPHERALVVKAFDAAATAWKADVRGATRARHALGVLEILGELRVDGETLAAVLLALATSLSTGERERLAAAFSPAVARLADGVARMEQIHALSGDVVDNGQDRGVQVEALRKMLLAMVEDLRVVLIKLADQVQRLRDFGAAAGDEARRCAHETLDIFAPLANRLGVWRMKWELEDLAFRVLEPELYKKIARQLDERRVDRERGIGEVIALLRRELAAAGVEAEVTGRPKHIYSIVKKMRRKRVPFEEIYDARAVRILTREVKDCYTALGIVHNLWQPIPREFDDYIAKPKGNNYRSLHTAVIGPEGKALEVQIRTWEMHQHSELGVAAHWRYKEGAGQDSRYDDKIAWVRQILEWKDELPDGADLAEQFRTALFRDTIYVLTPQGRVVDLPRGSTPVDFAYAVHSDLGHRCRGARVNGALVPLNYRLDNAQRVEIIAAKQGGPSRDWLNPDLHYVASPRARAKVRQWFKALELAQTVADGRAIVERELARRGLTSLSLDRLAERLALARVDDLCAAVARGEINTRQLAHALGDESPPVPEEAAPPLRRAPTPSSGRGIVVGGVGDLLTVYARCCRPVPPDPISGYVTRGRGFSVHRRDCATLARLLERHPERVQDAEWSVAAGMLFETDVLIEAADRPGLLRDVYDVVARERVNITAANTLTRAQVARMFFTLQVSGSEQLSRVLGLLRDLPGVSRALRR
ncbi:MAG TPA: bifunctional (p)ppGpp synthetase/guanosine-3',5'-bis(diphosphate) 3'-pyrophosphohydrolase [Pelomicrobium sp.]|nr:bifunctional (p)ppGpp synthetase/guanosine-3',5'-bis(diphosphate) 3'-pyrophosphohydrolase [Pelomicrobium sp.]